jgi:DNA-binding GntR family transcriptional regulator
MAQPAPGATPSGVASERIAKHLRKRILSGELAPGSRIMQEEIAAELGSSRLPVREALRIVEAEGLIVHKANSGSWVAALDLDDCVDVYKMRERLEPLALSESIPNLTTDDLARLEQLEREIEQTSDVDRFLALDR